MRLLWAVLWAAVVVTAVLAVKEDKEDVAEKLKEAKVKKVERKDNKRNKRQNLEFSNATSPPPTYKTAGVYTTMEQTNPPPITSPSRPVDCADHMMAGSTRSGVYEIYPFTCSCSKPVLVWCDMETDGGGWTIFLSRQEANQQLKFNRTWDEYKAGFGSPYDEYYMGNELLHVMTQSRAYTLRLNLEHATGGLNYATYETIRVNDEDNRYQMSLSGSLQGTSSTTYCFRYMSGRYFTTLDRDYDSYSGNCAANQGGGWWYYNCRPYFNPTSAGFNQSMELVCYSLKVKVTKLQLMLRPQICDSSLKIIHLKDLDCGCQVPH